MSFSAFDLRKTVERLLQGWTADGMPSRDGLAGQAAALQKQRGDKSLWKPAPTMLTATIDDGIGQGIDLIGRFAGAVGVRVVFAGPMLSPARIVEEARRVDADLAGLTVLQLDSEPLLEEIARELPSKTVLVAGGPAFRLDPDLAERTGVAFVAANVADFLRFLLDYTPQSLQRA
jgi:methylmalonyl-CoA mutase cobalamin-binding subunit